MQSLSLLHWCINCLYQSIDCLTNMVLHIIWNDVACKNAPKIGIIIGCLGKADVRCYLKVIRNSSSLYPGSVWSIAASHRSSLFSSISVIVASLLQSCFSYFKMSSIHLPANAHSRHGLASWKCAQIAGASSFGLYLLFSLFTELRTVNWILI